METNGQDFKGEWTFVGTSNAELDRFSLGRSSFSTTKPSHGFT